MTKDCIQCIINTLNELREIEFDKIKRERKGETTMSLYDYEVMDIAGNMKSMKDYEGKVLLIVNTATD